MSGLHMCVTYAICRLSLAVVKLRLMRSCTRALQVLMQHVGKKKQGLQQLTTLLFMTQDFTDVEACQANWVD